MNEPSNLDAEFVSMHPGTKVEVITGPDRGLLGRVWGFGEGDAVIVRDWASGPMNPVDTEYIADELRVVPEVQE